MTKIVGFALLAYLLLLAQRKAYRVLWNKNLKTHLEFSKTSFLKEKKENS